MGQKIYKMSMEYTVIAKKQGCSYQKHSGANLDRCHYYKYGNLSTSKNNNAIDWNNNYVNVFKFLMTHFLKGGEKRKEKPGGH